MPTTDQLSTQLDRLAAVDAGPFPVISLYLNLQPNEHGRDQFDTFLRKELTDRIATYEASGPERESLERDAERIREYVAGVDASVNGLALFACHAADLFEAIPLAAPIDAHRLYISTQPHVYPLARLVDEYPRYVALVVDTHSARIFVFATNSVVRTEHIEGTKTKHHKKGGWSQARYQRHTENFYVKHAKEVVDALARIVREENIDKVLISGDDVIVPHLRDQMTKEITDRLIDMKSLDVRTPQHEILEATMEALRAEDEVTDRQRVEELMDAYRGSGLGVVGADPTKQAFELGQVDELLITASGDGNEEMDALIAQAHNTSARIRFIQDTTLLAPYGGVGAFLRFKL